MNCKRLQVKVFQRQLSAIAMRRGRKESRFDILVPKLSPISTAQPPELAVRLFLPQIGFFLLPEHLPRGDQQIGRLA